MQLANRITQELLDTIAKTRDIALKGIDEAKRAKSEAYIIVPALIGVVLIGLAIDKYSPPQ